MPNIVRRQLGFGILCAVLAVFSAAEVSIGQERGSVTNLPIPRYVSLKASKANARRGPSLSHRIDWVFTRRHMPLEIYGEYENWRRVRDIDGYWARTRVGHKFTHSKICFAQSKQSQRAAWPITFSSHRLGVYPATYAS